MLISIDEPYLSKKKSGWYYRRRISGPLREAFGRSEAKRKLGGNHLEAHEAVKQCRAYNREVERRLSLAKALRDDASPDTRPPQVQSEASGQLPAAPDDTPRLSEAHQRAKDLRPVRDEKTRSIAVDQFTNALSDLAVASIKRKDVEDFILHLREKRSQGNKTIDRRLSSLSGIVQLAFDSNEIDRRNPFKGHHLPKETQANKRVPFNTKHLSAIKHSLFSDIDMRWETRVLLQILMLTPCRPLEIGGLTKSDVILEHEVPHLWIRGNDHRQLKNQGSNRYIPLAGTALVAAKEACRKGPGSGPLFGETSCKTSYLSQRLTKAIRAAGVPNSRRLVPYSFRHTFKEAMTAADVQAQRTCRIWLHSESRESGKSSHFRRDCRMEHYTRLIV